MKRFNRELHLSLSLVCFLCFLAPVFLSAQFQAEELAMRMKWEGFLKNAEVIGALKVGEGITKPLKVDMKLRDIEASGAWKAVHGSPKGYQDEWRYEVAAYQLDKLLGLGMVPPTVERRIKGRRGSLQLWCDIAMNELERNKGDIQIPDDRNDHVTKMTALCRAFDSLIGNIDRTQQNLCYTGDWRLILIDHSRGFRTSRFYVDQLIYGRDGMRKKDIVPLPRWFIANLKTLNRENIRKAVGDYLKFEEIIAVVQRKKLILKEVKELAAERGEENVLY
jgi:hypothetical protein